MPELMSETSRVVTRVHRNPQGAELQAGGGVRFRLWAPACEEVRVAFYAPGEKGPADIVSMTAMPGGWHEWFEPTARAGTRYQFVLPDGLRVPDPASRFQPEDVHGPSEVVDPAAYAWQDAGWVTRPWREAVIYELHVGAFTAAGTFLAVIERLDHLVTLGVTCLQIMPVAEFPGARNWGYDGVLPYAPDASYGRPEDFKSLIDAAHARGVMVMLDVVYNHFGPDGNYQALYAPAIFTDRHHTPWGAAVNFDGPHSGPVREFIIHNALYWIEEFNLDGLRLDAVHAILDDGAEHVLEELAARVRALRHPVHLVLENEENQASRLLRDESGVPTQYTAQWNDDIHHVLHVAAADEKTGYYFDYHGATHKLGRALAEGFAFQGEVMEFRGTARGEPSAMLPPTAFVAFIQNHDQVGNRAFGDRLGAVAPPAALRALVAVYLLLPQIPMLFMGEEWCAAQPFPFFCDFTGGLAEAVRRGRRLEFAKFPEFEDEAMRERIPDPQSPGTFESAKLRWDDRWLAGHAEWLELYRQLLTVRRERLLPLLAPDVGRAGAFEVLGPGAVSVRWPLPDGNELALEVNLSAHPVDGFAAPRGRTLWQEQETVDGTAGAWYVRWSCGLRPNPRVIRRASRS